LRRYNKADLADRLVNGLSGENKRWGAAIEAFGIAEAKLVGDVLVSSSFVSYAGQGLTLVPISAQPELFVHRKPT
jgi:dynein heavy chain